MIGLFQQFINHVCYSEAFVDSLKLVFWPWPDSSDVLSLSGSLPLSEASLSDLLIDSEVEADSLSEIDSEVEADSLSEMDSEIDSDCEMDSDVDLETEFDSLIELDSLIDIESLMDPKSKPSP